MNNNTDLFLIIYRNVYLRGIIFNNVKEYNIRLKYIRYNYFDIPIVSIINNKSLLLDKFKQHSLHSQHSQQDYQIEFQVEWFKKLIEYKELDLETFQIIYSTFKNEIDYYLTREANLNEITKPLILNGNLEILELMDGIIYDGNDPARKKAPLYGSMLPVKQFNVPSSGHLLSMNMLDYLINKRKVLVTEGYFNWSFLIIEKQSLSNINICEHYEYLEYLYENIIKSSPNIGPNRTNFKDINSKLLLLAIKTNDTRLFKLVFGDSFMSQTAIKAKSTMVQLCDGVKIGVCELHDLRINFEKILEFIGYEIKNKVQFQLFQLLLLESSNYSSVIVNSVLIDQGPNEFNMYNLVYDKVIKKLKILENSTHFHYTINCLSSSFI